MSGVSRSPEMVGLSPFTTCMYRGRKVMAPNMAKPTTKPMAEVVGERPVPQQRQRDDRFGRPPFHPEEGGTTRTTGGHRQGDDRARRPLVGVPPQAGHQDQAGGRRRQQGRAQVVDDVVDADRRRREHGRGDHQGDDGDGDVDVEDPVPDNLSTKKPPSRRTEDAGHAEDGAEDPLVTAPLAGGDDVTDTSHGAHDEPAGAQSLDGPEQDQLEHVPAEPGQDRADDEDDDGRLEEELPSVLVARASPTAASTPSRPAGRRSPPTSGGTDRGDRRRWWEGRWPRWSGRARPGACPSSRPTMTSRIWAFDTCGGVPAGRAPASAALTDMARTLPAPPRALDPMPLSVSLLPYDEPVRDHRSRAEGRSCP